MRSFFILFINLSINFNFLLTRCVTSVFYEVGGLNLFLKIYFLMTRKDAILKDKFFLKLILNLIINKKLI